MNKYLEKLLIKNELPVVFDYDGVLFEARWYKETINMRDETFESLLMANMVGENLDTKPISFMKKLVKEHKGNTYYVLSHMHNYIEYDFKRNQIGKYYPNIPVSHVLMATSVDNKTEHLEIIKKMYGGFIYIDDNHPNLMRFEDHFDDSCKFFHVSSLYV